MTADLSVIIVSYNTRELTLKCLGHVYDDIRETRGMKIEVIVVDNNSSDHTADSIEKDFPGVILIKNSRNTGFADANNQGIKKSCGNLLMLLNSDAYIKPATFGIIKKELQGKKGDVFGVRLQNSDGSCQQSAGFFPTPGRVFRWMFFMDFLPFFKPYHIRPGTFYDGEHECDWVSGACMIVRKEAVEKAGLMDSRIFMYGEEVEWCYRIRKKGLRVVYSPVFSVDHYKGGSSDGDHTLSGICEEFRSLKYFYRKHMPLPAKVFTDACILSGVLMRIILFAIIRRFRYRLPSYVECLKVAG